jgi:hypothetical protein
MEKFSFGKEECKNLIAMIKSPDESNHEIAKTILESLDIEENLQWVFIIIVFAGKSERFWMHNNFYNELTKRFGSFLQASLENRAMSLTLLNTVLPNEVKLKSPYVELYFELYFLEMKKSLNQYGYDFVNEIQIKAKDE